MIKKLVIAICVLPLVACGGKKETVPSANIEACQSIMRSQANNPSTVKFHFTEQGTDINQNGEYLVRLGFSAKNSFGLEKHFDSLCVFEPKSLTIKESGAWEVGS